MPTPSSPRTDHTRLLCGITVLAAVLASPLCASAASLPLDSSFGTFGIVDQPFADLGGEASLVLVQRDGRILASGSYISAIGLRGIPIPRDITARYNADGTLDHEFANQGFLNDITLGPVLLQRDDKIVAFGNRGLRRWNADGSPDADFATDGAAGIYWSGLLLYGGSLAQQADGKIVAAGHAGYNPETIGIVRFNADGSIDPAFNDVGAVSVQLGAGDSDVPAGLIIQPDGKLVVAATTDYGGVTGTLLGFGLLRFNANGTTDSTFGTDGRAFAATGPAVFHHALAVVRQPNGRLIVAGIEQDFSVVGSKPNLLLVGFAADGALDSGFGTGGLFRTPVDGGFSYGVGSSYYLVNAQTAPDGKILVVFGADSPAPSTLMRLTVNGAPDGSFGNAGRITSVTLPWIKAFGLQPDGNLVLGGTSAAGNFAVERRVNGPVPSIEFYNAALDHYFLSINTQEVDDLDLGVHPGWARTGQMFSVFGNGAASVAANVVADPACRFYIPPQHGDSHFFSIDPAECIAIQNKVKTDPNYSGYVYETSEAFYATLPSIPSGACPAAMVPVYRLWNQRVDSNHRYTADPSIKAQMIAMGYVAEGYGPDAVAMCVPQ